MGDCILWTRGKDSSGYGIVNIRGERIPKRAHVLAWEAVHGPVPSGYHIHHKCEVKACVNPDHLECLTPDEHRARHRLTYCKRGHLLEGENVYVRPGNGHRMCRVCSLERLRSRERVSVKATHICEECGVGYVGRSDSRWCGPKCQHRRYYREVTRAKGDAA